MAGIPASVEQFKEKIRQSDALLIATPEYNYSIPGVLKNALDWASRPAQTSPLFGKPLAIMGAGGRMGTSRAQYHLRQVAVFTNMLPINKPEVTIAISGSFNQEGDLVNEESRELIRQLLQNLMQWTIQLNK